MTTREHLLICLSEECAEVSHRISKALRFGEGEVQEGQGLNNLQRIELELNDLYAVASMLGMFFPNNLLMDAKAEKLGKWIDYARSQRALSEEVND